MASEEIQTVEVMPVETEELLIEEVRSRPMMYNFRDPHYKNIKKKSDVWAEIARATGLENGDTAKDKWRNLKQGYKNALKRVAKYEASGSRAKKFKPWRFIEQMAFLKDHIMDEASTSSNIPANPTNNSNNVNETETVEEALSDDENEMESTQGTNDSDLSRNDEKLRGKKVLQALDKEVITFLRSRTPKETKGTDKIDSLKSCFQAYYASVKSMSRTNQIKIKRIFSKAILDIEEEESLLENDL
ncbi:uncharacterized protein LOC135843985 [Planococcus citri]|uniref:uncharacterized protein LOC135831448 n=1 Tax=Planococcus citri TaxID=170843 RepID=UPI0031FA23F3